MTKYNKEKVTYHLGEILKYLDVDPGRPGLSQTPQKVAESLAELTGGSNVSTGDLIKSSLFKTTNSDLVVLKNLEFYSLCEHHLLPFFGQVDIAFSPNKNLIGFGTIARVVDALAAKLQVQENLTNEIAEVLWKGIKPQGIFVQVKARHFCMMMRGAKKQNIDVLTQSSRGIPVSY
ncbi:MAG: GTP cyclohydrolase I [bacterium]|nr:GTP cyclohydrolase I [bacterium]